MAQIEKGKRFGKLIVLEKTKRKHGRNNYYLCQCDCGNLVEVSSARLGRYTNSCGCIRKENANELCKKNEKEHQRKQMQYFDDTQITQIKGNKPYSTNSTGFRGVYLDKRTGKYIAHITLRRKKKVLGYFQKIEDAIQARKNAEEEYFSPIIERYNNELPPNIRQKSGM